MTAAARGQRVSMSPAAVEGTLAFPAVIFSYKNTGSEFMRLPSEYAQLLFSSTPRTGDAYTVRTYYEELSDTLLSMQGQVLGWVQLDSNEAFYTGTPGTCTNPFNTNNCNGIFSDAATVAMQNGMRVALIRVDTGPSGIDFGQFDNNGPDGIPNSIDDDGYVDLVMFAHATRDGACGGATNNHIWSHRFVFANVSVDDFQDFITDDDSNRPGFGKVRISDYFVTSALGGNTTGCDSTQIMPVGTAAHEFGHALGLPDLYASDGTEGIGQWGLMGSGNFTSPGSPSRMEAWSLNEMGWVFVRPLTTTGTYHLGAAPVSDTAFLVNVQGANPRNESFLLENRQRSQADSAVIRIHCFRSEDPPHCGSPGGGGLLIWHLDQQKINSASLFNNGIPRGLRLVQADGLNHLQTSSAPAQRRRGDAGDPYPGDAANTAFSFRTNPAARKNADGSFVGFAVDSIRQIVLGGEMAFRLRFGTVTVVRASDTAAVIQFEGSPFNVFRDLLNAESTYTVSVADTQISANGRTRWRFASWSDGGARTHTIPGSLTGVTYTANLDRDFKLIATAAGPGSVTADTPGVNLTAGEFFAAGDSVQLTAVPNSGEVFGGWSGDTISSNPVITLPMGRPYTVVATFGSFAITSAPARPAGVMGAAYSDTLKVSGGTGTNSWSVTGGALPSGLTLNAATGVVSGFPRQTGNFSYTVTVTSSSLSQMQTFSLSITAPALATADVVAHFLGTATPLNADQVRYLDFLGNSNTQFDIGDFLAWVKATGAPLSAAMLEAMRQNGGRP